MVNVKLVVLSLVLVFGCQIPFALAVDLTRTFTIENRTPNTWVIVPLGDKPATVTSGDYGYVNNLIAALPGNGFMLRIGLPVISGNVFTGVMHIMSVDTFNKNLSGKAGADFVNSLLKLNTADIYQPKTFIFQHYLQNNQGLMLGPDGFMYSMRERY